MSEITVTLPSEVADDLERRARRDGLTVHEAAVVALREYLTHDPFEFVGMAPSDDITGAAADEALERYGYVVDLRHRQIRRRHRRLPVRGCDIVDDQSRHMPPQDADRKAPDQTSHSRHKDAGHRRSWRAQAGCLPRENHGYRHRKSSRTVQI